MKYSTIELELVGVVWATEHFKNYLYDSEFEILPNQRVFYPHLMQITVTKPCTAD